MRKLRIVVLTLVMIFSMIPTAFALEATVYSDSLQRVEIPIPAEMQALASAELIYENGTSDVIAPEVRCYKLVESTRTASESNLYVIELYASTLSKSGSDESSQCDASVTASMVYRAETFGVNTLLETHVTFAAGPDVHFGTRTITYGAAGGTTRTDSVTGISTSYDRRNINIQSDGINGVFCFVNAPLSTWGVSETLRVELREWG